MRKHKTTKRKISIIDLHKRNATVTSLVENCHSLRAVM